jgi:hypothetical protein
MKTIEISEDQSTVTVDGVKYEAVGSISCEDCAFNDQNKTITPECWKSPCSPALRKDKQNVAFIKSDK